MNLLLSSHNIRTAAGHKYVDLGLSVNWALCNVGARQYNDCGDYFAIDKMEGHYGINNKRSAGNTVDWGMGWRIPTKQEFEELLTSCYMIWIKNDQTWGWAVIKRGCPGQFLFLPTGGYRDLDGNICSQQRACYWTSSDYQYDPKFAWAYEMEGQYKLCVSNDLHYGFLIRPVLMREYEHLYI